MVTDSRAADVHTAGGALFSSDLQAVYPGWAAFRAWADHADLTVGVLIDAADLGACAVNGEVMRRGRSRQLIFSVPALIAKPSGVLPLFPGDVIFTGTPAGAGRTPRRRLNADDELVSSIEGMRRTAAAVRRPVPPSFRSTANGGRRP